MTSNSNCNDKLPLDRYQEIEKPVHNILTGFCLLIAWYLIAASAELAVSTLWPITEDAFDSFGFFVADWCAEAIITIFIVQYLLRKNINKGPIPILGKPKSAVLIIALSFVGGCMAYYIYDVIYSLSIQILPEHFPAKELERIIESFDQKHQKAVLFFLVVVVTPISEEILMRGFCYNLLRRRYSVIRSISLTSIVFIVFHPVIAWIPHLLFATSILCLVYEKTKNIWPPVILHASINLGSFLFS